MFCKVFKALDFIMQLAKDFKRELPLKVLFCSVVSPILGYGCIVWDPYSGQCSLSEFS